VGRNHFRGRKSNFSVTTLKKTSNQGVINESLRKLRGLVTIFENVCTDHVHINLIPHLFLIFLHILQIFFLHDCQCYHIWKCAHRPSIYQPSNIIPHFFLIFCIFYIYVSSLIANVTIFGNVRTDLVLCLVS
jgi:hypothetical protein